MLIIVALTLMTAGGALYIVSAGNPNMAGVAKRLITKTLIGFGLFFLSWLIIFTVLRFISANTDIINPSNANWFEFTCETESAFDTNTNLPTP